MNPAELEMRQGIDNVGAAATRTDNEDTRLRAVEDPLYNMGRESWPELELDRSAFERYLAGRNSDDARAHAADLYLACACATGSLRAIEIVDARSLAAVLPTIVRIDRSPAFLDEALQRLRERLFVSRGIAEYSGRGALSNFLRIVAQRIALNLHREERRAAGRLDSDDAELLDRAADSSAAPDLEYLKARYRAEFTDALRAAVTGLPAEQRLLLRLYFVQGMSLEALGARYKVHLSTISRRLSRARDTIAAETRRLLAERVLLTRSEFDSVGKLVMSQLDLSLAELLA